MKDTRQTARNKRMLGFAKVNAKEPRTKPERCDICDQPFGPGEGEASEDIWRCAKCVDAIERGLGLR